MKRFPFSIAVVFSFGVFLCSSGHAFADTLGQSTTFRTNSSYDAFGADTVAATLQAIGQHAYFYVDDRYWADASYNEQSTFSAALERLAAQFDTVIYPTLTSFWGSENNPGVDGDPHIFIVLEKLVAGSGGYFQTINNYPMSVAPKSNGHEMFYVDTHSLMNGAAPKFATHEFQHLISFNQKELLRNVSDDVWLNEARSEYSLTLAGYNTPFANSILQSRMATFLATPSDSLVEWPNTTADYGITTMFIHYLSDQRGPQAIVATEQTPAAGAAAIPDFENIFTNWMIASLVNDRSLDSRYGYIADGLNRMHVTPTSTLFVGANTRSNFSTSLEEWQPVWIRANMTSNSVGTVSVTIAGAPDVSWHGAMVAKYTDGTVQVLPLPALVNGTSLMSIDVVLAQGFATSIQSRTIAAKPVTITFASGTSAETLTPIPMPPPTSGLPKDGDLIRHGTEPEIYVVWGSYRRYLPQGVLQLYGFENRPITSVSDDVFLRYQTSNYVREVDQKKVYALWPDGTKHWINITAAQWDASGRDWNAIFTVNTAEVGWYTTGKDVVQ